MASSLDLLCEESKKATLKLLWSQIPSHRIARCKTVLKLRYANTLFFYFCKFFIFYCNFLISQPLTASLNGHINSVALVQLPPPHKNNWTDFEILSLILFSRRQMYTAYKRVDKVYYNLTFCERFETRSHFKSRLSLIVRVNGVLNRTVVVDSD